MESISEELEKIIAIDKLELYQFLDQCANEIVEKENASIDKLNGTKNELKNCKSYVKKILRSAVIDKEYTPDPNLSTTVNEAIHVCYDVRKGDIFQSLAKDTVLKKGHNLVENFDWKLKWILGSSDIASIKEPILQVDLHCITLDIDNGKQRNTINFEANLQKVDELIQALTNIKKELPSS